MKKLSLLISCVVAMLIVSNTSFAAEEAVADPATTCTCSDCSAVPFAYPPAQKVFGNRLADRKRSQVSALAPQAQAGEQSLPFAVNASRRDARRASRAVPAPFFAFAPPVVTQEGEADGGKVKAPVINFMSIVGTPRYPYAVPPQDFAAIAGQGGKVKAPVVNFMSIVRAPRPNDGKYPGYHPATPNCPCQSEAQ